MRSAHDVAAACCLAMAEVRVRLPLGAFQFGAWGSLERARRAPRRIRGRGARDRRFKSVRTDFRQGVAKPGIAPGTMYSWSGELETAGSNPATLILIAVGPVLVQAGAC